MTSSAPIGHAATPPAQGPVAEAPFPSTPTKAAHAGAPASKVAATFGWGGLGLVALLGLVSGGGISTVLMSVAMYATVVALVGLIRGRVGWAHIQSRAKAAGTLVAAFAMFIVAGALAPAETSTPAAPSAASQTSSGPASTTKSSTTNDPTTSTPVASTTAKTTPRLVELPASQPPATAASAPKSSVPPKTAAKTTAPKTVPKTTTPKTTAPKTTAPKPTAAKKTAPKASATKAKTQAPKPTTPAKGGLDPRFKTCKAAKAAGYGPYVKGKDPEYDWYRDADKDGIVCE